MSSNNYLRTHYTRSLLSIEIFHRHVNRTKIFEIRSNLLAAHISVIKIGLGFT